MSIKADQQEVKLRRFSRVTKYGSDETSTISGVTKILKSNLICLVVSTFHLPHGLNLLHKSCFNI